MPASPLPRWRWGCPRAIAVALLLARGRFPGRALLNSLVHLPLVLPPVVIGYLLLVIFGTRGPVGGWLYDTLGLRLVLSWTGAALAAAVVTFPLQVRSIRLALEAVDPRLELAALSIALALAGLLLAEVAGRWARRLAGL